MLSERQQYVLKAIVEEYVKSAHPVSSKGICETLKCSSATVRSEMNYLETIGLLEKTHISSGRIPSEKGYRYYVDNILKPAELTGEEMLKLQTIVNNKSLEISDAIAKSMEIVSELTHYTAVVLGGHSKNNLVTKIEVIPIDVNNLVAIVVTDKGHVEHKNIFIEEQVDISEIKQTVDLINKMIVGSSLDDVGRILEFQIKPIIGQYVKKHQAIYNAFYNAFSDFATESVYRSGTQNFLMQPEFNDTERIRKIISKFEDKDIVKTIKEEDNGINIYIGSENNFDDNVTIVKTKYMINGEEGTIALIGPKRMEYDRVITLLNYIMDNIGMR